MFARNPFRKQSCSNRAVLINPYEDDPGQLRSWQLDCLPWVIDTAEWEMLEAGLKQRSRLLEHLLDDLYGERKVINEGLLPPELVFTHPGYLFAVADSPTQLDRPLLIFHGTDVGRFWVTPPSRLRAPAMPWKIASL